MILRVDSKKFDYTYFEKSRSFLGSLGTFLTEKFGENDEMHEDDAFGFDFLWISNQYTQDTPARVDFH